MITTFEKKLAKAKTALAQNKGADDFELSMAKAGVSYHQSKLIAAKAALAQRLKGK